MSGAIVAPERDTHIYDDDDGGGDGRRRGMRGGRERGKERREGGLAVSKEREAWADVAGRNGERSVRGG